MKVKYIILYLLAGLSITSCSNNEEIAADSGTLLKVSAGVISNPAQSRITYDGSTTKWETTDCIGVTGSGSTNVKYQAAAAAATSDFTATSNSITAMPSQTYTAYYPFGGTEGSANNGAVAISVDNTIDYMYATTTPNNSYASFTFQHQLAMFSVKVTSDGTNEVNGATWKITHGICGGSIVQSTGVVTVNNIPTSMQSYKNSGTGTYLLVPAQTLTGMISVAVNGVTYSADLSDKSIILEAGKHTTLTLTLTSNSLAVAYNNITTWTTAAADDSGDKYAGCTYSGHEWVQLQKGGIKWATTNIGASKPTEYGDYYAWGATYKYLYDSSSSTYTSKNVWSEANPSGYYAGEQKLPATNDAATVLWGSSWRMPTADEFRKLINDDGDDTDTYTLTPTPSSEWVDTTSGFITFQCITQGITTGKTLILPAAGCRDADSFSYKGISCGYWSSTTEGNCVCYLRFYSNIINIGSNQSRIGYGFSIRPVMQ